MHELRGRPVPVRGGPAELRVLPRRDDRTISRVVVLLGLPELVLLCGGRGRLLELRRGQSLRRLRLELRELRRGGLRGVRGYELLELRFWLVCFRRRRRVVHELRRGDLRGGGGGDGMPGVRGGDRSGKFEGVRVQVVCGRVLRPGHGDDGLLRVCGGRVDLGVLGRHHLL